MILPLKNGQHLFALLQNPANCGPVLNVVICIGFIQLLMDKYNHRFGGGSQILPKPLKLTLWNMGIPSVKVSAIVVGSIGGVIRIEHNKMHAL